MFLAAWNGLFFMERVVGNYHVCRYKAKLAAEAMQARKAAAPTAECEYESEEHFSTSITGMRVSVSKTDLAAIQQDRPGSRNAEAYPAGEAVLLSGGKPKVA